MSDPFEPATADPFGPDATFDDTAASEPAEEDITPETPVVQYAPTRVNSQAHEKIQAGERAHVGQTVNVSQD